MDRITAFTILTIAFTTSTSVVLSDDKARPPMGMHHGGTVLFVAQIEASKVLPIRKSSASGTGAFLVDPVKRVVRYELTFHGLEYGPPTSIALYNFGAGGNGALLHTICGSDNRPCPNLTSATITGTLDVDAQQKPSGELLGEYASARVYVQIVGGDGKAEIRGQLEPNNAMLPVKNYVAHLAPTKNQKARGTGTAVLSEVYFADGRVSVFYQATVADTSGAPKSAALVNAPAAIDRSQLEILSQNALPKLKILPSRASATGGTMTGQYEDNRNRNNALFVTKMMSDDAREIGIVISTNTVPEGELYGVFKPVH